MSRSNTQPIPPVSNATYKTHGNVRFASHYINYTTSFGVVKQLLNRLIGMVTLDEDKVRARILKEKDQTHSPAGETAAKKIAKHKKRLSEISIIYAKLYDDRALEVMSDENFRMLSTKFQNEQANWRRQSSKNILEFLYRPLNERLVL